MPLFSILPVDTLPLEERLQLVISFSAQMLEWVRNRGKIIIIIHDNPDPDCLASALALQSLFAKKIQEDATIAFSGMIGRSENLIMAGILDIPLVPLEIVDLSKYGVVCMLDTQPGTGNNSLDPAVPVDVVIDHHPLQTKSRDCKWVDVRVDYGVTATILYEYLLANDIEIDSILATAIFYAIKSDTQDLGREANLPDREAYLKLFPTVDKQLLYQITNPRQPVEYFTTIRRTLDYCRIYGTAVLVNMQGVVFPELVAEMADFLLKMENVEAVLSFGEYSKELVISLRTSTPDMNAGEMVKRLVKGVGVGGGHALMAGGKICPASLDAGFISELEKLLTDRFLAEVGAENVEPLSIKL
ncbi:MAG: DHH family phosphoesterase [Geobacteraceae bacterium]|nr:DHH family phosphoesterase [Geobacteraceae bacterium]